MQREEDDLVCTVINSHKQKGDDLDSDALTVLKTQSTMTFVHSQQPIQRKEDKIM